MSKRFGGSSARVLGLLKSLPAGSAALACLADSPLCREAGDSGLDVHVLGEHKLDIMLPFRLKQIIREGKFQLLDTQNPQSKLWCSLVEAGTDCALVSTLNSWYEQEYNGSLRGRLYQNIERWTTSRTDLFIIVAEDIRRRLIDQGADPAAITLIPNAVAVDRAAIEGDGAWLRSQFALPAGARVCVAVGRLVWAKGYRHLLHAMAALTNHDVHAVIVGEGREDEALAECCDALGLRDRVVFAGYREHGEALRIMKAADLFVMPSVSEGTPISLLEAAMLGIPIVASRVGGIPSLVTDGCHAVLVEPGDEMALAAAIDRVFAAPEAARAMAMAARQHVADSFSAMEQARATQAAYAQAIDRSRRRKASPSMAEK